MKKRMTLLAALCIAGFILKAQNASLTLYFDTDKSTLTSNHQAQLKAMVDTLELSNCKVEIFGHTDNAGSADYNMRLSDRRARTVAAFFEKLKMADSLLVTAHHGLHKPVIPNHSPENMAKNRRVEIRVACPSAPQMVSSIWELYQQTLITPQVFEIDPFRDTIIHCEQGTIIRIPAQVFGKGNKHHTGNKVTFSVSEIYNKSDIILANLTTTSGGEILQTGGMFYLEAMAEGEKLNLLPGKEITIMAPTNNFVNEAQVFSGQRTHGDSIMDWELQNNNFIQGVNTMDLLRCCRLKCISREKQKCPFFFCKIRQWFKKNPTNSTLGSNILIEEDVCGTLYNIMAKHGISQDESYSMVMDKLMKIYNVNNEIELAEAIAREEMQELESKLESNKASIGDVNKYLLKNSNLGWVNIDYFMRYNQEGLITMSVKLLPGKDKDVKLVFKNHNIVLPANYNKDGFYYFKGIPKDEPITIVALQSNKGAPMIAMQETITTIEPVPIEPVACTLEELKQKLLVLNL